MRIWAFAPEETLRLAPMDYGTSGKTSGQRGAAYIGLIYEVAMLGSRDGAFRIWIASTLISKATPRSHPDAMTADKQT